MKFIIIPYFRIRRERIISIWTGKKLKQKGEDRFVFYKFNRLTRLKGNESTSKFIECGPRADIGNFSFSCLYKAGEMYFYLDTYRFVNPNHSKNFKTELITRQIYFQPKGFEVLEVKFLEQFVLMKAKLLNYVISQVSRSRKVILVYKIFNKQKILGDEKKSKSLPRNLSYYSAVLLCGKLATCENKDFDFVKIGLNKFVVNSKNENEMPVLKVIQLHEDILIKWNSDEDLKKIGNAFVFVNSFSQGIVKNANQLFNLKEYFSRREESKKKNKKKSYKILIFLFLFIISLTSLGIFFDVFQGKKQDRKKEEFSKFIEMMIMEDGERGAVRRRRMADESVITVDADECEEESFLTERRNSLEM